MSWFTLNVCAAWPDTLTQIPETKCVVKMAVEQAGNVKSRSSQTGFAEGSLLYHVLDHGSSSQGCCTRLCQGGKTCLPFPRENTCFQLCAGLHWGGEEAFTYLGSRHGFPQKNTTKWALFSLMFVWSCFHTTYCVCVAWEHLSQRIILWTVTDWILFKFAFMDRECRYRLLLKWKSISLHSR